MTSLSFLISCASRLYQGIFSQWVVWKCKCYLSIMNGCLTACNSTIAHRGADFLATRLKSKETCDAQTTRSAYWAYCNAVWGSAHRFSSWIPCGQASCSINLITFCQSRECNDARSCCCSLVCRRNITSSSKPPVSWEPWDWGHGWEFAVTTVKISDRVIWKWLVEERSHKETSWRTRETVPLGWVELWRVCIRLMRCGSLVEPHTWPVIAWHLQAMEARWELITITMRQNVAAKHLCSIKMKHGIRRDTVLHGR